MAKLSALQDAFTGSVVNTAVWNSSTGGAYTLDQVNDLVTLAVGTVASTYNTLGAAGPYDATSSSLYAEVGTGPNGNGGVQTILKLAKDVNNAIQAVVSSTGSFLLQVITAGVTVSTTLPAYDPNAHGWWRFTETGGSQFAFAVAADGYNWTTLATVSYAWAATAVAVYFQTGATDTEPAGQAATIQHVNTMLGGPFNINWPVVEEAWAPHWNCNGGDVPLDRYVNVGPRTRQQSSVNRGRQYELDQVRAGEASLTLANTDAVLDPTNSAGPYYGHIMPFQPYRKRAQWPPTRNLLTQVQATAGDLGGQPLGTINIGNNGPSIFSSTDSTGGSFVSSATAWQGGAVMQFAVPVSTAPSHIAFTPQPAVLPGAVYTGSLQARNITASTTVQVYASIQWLDAAQNVISTSAGTTTTLTGAATAWTALSVTGTAPANAAMMYAGLRLAVTAPSTVSVQVDGWQLEQAAAVSAWTCPGIWFPMYGGFVERWPSSWDMGGTYGLVKPVAVDGMALLSQRILTDPLTEEIYKHGPRFVYPLNDPQASTYATDQAGLNPPAPVASSRYGVGVLAFGTTITSASPTGRYIGSSGSVMTVTNPSYGQNLLSAATYVNLAAAGIKGPAAPSGSWSRMFAFRCTGGLPSSLAILWSSVGQLGFNGSAMYWQITSTGILQLLMSGPTSGQLAFQPSSNVVTDSNWHLVTASYSHASAQLMINLDGASAFWTSFNPVYEPTSLVLDSVGAWVDPSSGGGTSWSYQGDLSFVCEWPTALSSQDAVDLYNAWKSSFSGESTNARYSRILRYAGYIGVSSIQTGVTTSMGPAAFGGQDSLSALQAVVDTENGTHYADRSGTVTFRARSARYNSLTPTYVFGERTDLGEWPYEDAQLDYDPTHLSNLVQITQASSNQVFTAQDATSQTSFFPRSLQRTINASSTLECQDAGNYLLSRYKNPATRVSTLVLHPSANPMMWAMCLSLELDTRVRVMRRPPTPANAIAVDCFVENIAWTLDDQGEARVILQCSPVDTTPYAIFTSFHTTLAATISSGVTSVTINAGADSTNLAAAQIGVNQQLVLGQNSANQETVTVKAVAATSPGWTTCVITLTAATTKSHTAGDLVNEPLPAGVTDPTTYDASAKFDSAAFSY